MYILHTDIHVASYTQDVCAEHALSVTLVHIQATVQYADKCNWHSPVSDLSDFIEINSALT